MQQVELKRYHNTKPKQWWQKFYRKKIVYTELLDRTIYSNVPDEQIPNNKIQTSKYNYLTFIPLNLIEQFTKLSNIYFLFIGILQIIPAISLSEGRPTIFFPLFTVVLISMVKDFIEDRKRHRNDEKQNESQVQYLSGVGYVQRKWQDLRVGDIIKVKKDQYFPCDVILLDHPKDQKTSFIETKNLDGETNLKLKKICQNLNFLRELSDLDLSTLQVQFSFQKPNPFLSTFNGNVKIRNVNYLVIKKKYMIQNSNVLLRGCSLKINQWVVGMCIYTGHQSKILLNSGVKKTKVSTLQRYLNSYFRYIFLFQFSVTLISSIIFGILYGINEENLGYINLNGNIAANMFFTWGSWFISFSNFIPISLLVTVEMVRYGQGTLLNKDQLNSSKGQFTEVQTSSINEELGQVKYIMSDKTGTLTQNLMEFKCFYVDGEHFGSTIDNNRQEYGMHEELSSSRPGINKNGQINMQELKQLSNKIMNVDFPQRQKIKMENEIMTKSNHGRMIRQSLLHLSLCHNVITEKNSYTSSSPDELALVSFAKYVGYQFIQKNDYNQLEICEKIGDKTRFLRYKLLHTLQFSSDRKRMSVIVEDLNFQDKKIMLLTKGADEIILSRLNKSDNEILYHKKIEQVQKILFDYACKGLRTLVLAQKQLGRQEYEQWNDKYNEALTIIGPERYEVIDNLQSQLQMDLQIVAATAIQDKLQDQVKETIQDLKKSNIKVWMLTGDKKQTAVSIGFACGLIDKESERITLDCDAEHAKTLLVNLISMMHYIHSAKVTIVSGQFIKKIDDQARIHLENILSQSESVICCRVSPKDKQEITKMVKKWGITLAIGDGANDVNMINSANIGVGVRGIQGSQATRAADYVITEFKLLKRLVVYHGINYYHRNTNVMLYTLYKNMLVTLPNLLYGPLSMQSGTYIYDIWAIQFFNIFYVSMPIVYYGLFDILYSWKEIRSKPWYYNEGQQSQFFNRKILIRLLVETFVIALILLYTVYFATEYQISGNGLLVYQQWSGNLILAIVVVSCNIRVVVISNQFNIIQGFFVSIGILGYYLTFYLVGVILQTDVKNTLRHQFISGTYWLLLFFFCFLIEGVQLFMMTVANMSKVIEKSKEKGIRDEQRLKEIEMTGIDREYEKEKTMKTEGIDEKTEIGGYAFAEDDNRMALATEIESTQHQKSLNML